MGYFSIHMFYFPIKKGFYVLALEQIRQFAAKWFMTFQVKHFLDTFIWNLHQMWALNDANWHEIASVMRVSLVLMFAIKELHGLNVFASTWRFILVCTEYIIRKYPFTKREIRLNIFIFII